MCVFRVLGLLLIGGLFTATGLRAADPASLWSKPAGDVQARLFVLPTTQKELDETYDVYIEFEETGVETSLGVEHKPVTLHFAKDQFQFTVTDSKGAAVAPADRPPSTGAPDNRR